MKVTVCFDNIRVVVPCGDGTLLVRDLMHEAVLRYRKATGKTDAGPTITSLSSLSGGGLLDPDDKLIDVADDREQILAHLSNQDNGWRQHVGGGDGSSSVGTNSPDYYQHDSRFIDINNVKLNTNIKRESAKRLSMHGLSSRDYQQYQQQHQQQHQQQQQQQLVPQYSALSLPRESRRREPLGQDSVFDYYRSKNDPFDNIDIKNIIINNEPGPLGLHVVPCIDLLGNGQGLRVEDIDPNSRIANDGQIDIHDKILKINGHNLLRIPFTKVHDIFRNCANEKFLTLSIIKNSKTINEINNKIDDNDNINNKMLIKKKKNDNKKPSTPSTATATATTINEQQKLHDDTNIKKLQCSNYNLLQNANTRKIGKKINIELTKSNDGLGFSLTTRDNPAGGNAPIYIRNILPKGAAIEDGRLLSGDRLLEVNKIPMTDKCQSDVVTLLRNIKIGDKVLITVSRQEEINNSNDNSNNSNDNNDDNNNIPETTPDIPIKSKKYDSIDGKNSSNSININNSNNSSNYDVLLSPRKNRIILTFDIPVHDSEKAGLGVSVKGKTNSNEDNSCIDVGIFIKSVIHGGAASRDGRLRENDQLLNINGISLVGLSNSDAMETLRRSMFNTNSPISDIITLTVARRVSLYDNNNHTQSSSTLPNDKKKNYYDMCQIDMTNGIYVSEKLNKPIADGDKNNNIHNVEEDDNDDDDVVNGGANDDHDDNNQDLLSPSTSSPWNPVIDRLTDQYNKNSLRNESYCLATNKTWLEPIANSNKKFTLGLDKDLINEELHNDDDDKDSNNYMNETVYDDTLDEFNSVNKFSRDALGRQSMSEKRHAALDAKNTDTYKRNKKLRDGKSKESSMNNDDADEDQDQHEDEKNKMKNNSTFDNNNSSLTSNHKKEESSFEAARKKFEKNLNLNDNNDKSEYVYTIPGCNNKYIPARKHWLVDDVHVDDVGIGGIDDEQLKNNCQGFSNSRGDVKQSSLNSALDDRYKKSKKKSGIRSMLRLGKNRKSLNFGDNIETRHETTSNYCSGTINYIA